MWSNKSNDCISLYSLSFHRAFHFRRIFIIHQFVPFLLYFTVEMPLKQKNSSIKWQFSIKWNTSRWGSQRQKQRHETSRQRFLSNSSQTSNNPFKPVKRSSQLTSFWEEKKNHNISHHPFSFWLLMDPQRQRKGCDLLTEIITLCFVHQLGTNS